MSDYTPDNMTVANGPKPFTPRADDGLTAATRPVASSSASSLQGNSSGTSAAAPTQPVSPPDLPQPMPEVKGRIEVHDEVVEKVAALAAMEVEGVADLGGDIARALESVRERIGVGQKRGDQGIKAKVSGREVTVDVTIMIEYGHVVMDVARNVKYNVAHQTSRMLGLKVVEVNVIVDDVKLPEAPKPAADSDDGYVSIDS
jgi:uncharacterized alkaline shock family protein YloU